MARTKSDVITTSMDPARSDDVSTRLRHFFGERQARTNQDIGVCGNTKK